MASPNRYYTLSTMRMRHSRRLRHSCSRGRNLPGIMKLLSHSSPRRGHTPLGIALPDLQREYQQARSQPRHLVPTATIKLQTLICQGWLRPPCRTTRLEMFVARCRRDFARRLNRLANHSVFAKPVPSKHQTNRQRLASYAELGITGLMPSSGLCRVLRVNGSGADTESWVCSA
jgi:hypothetical protein